ncbi:hypothetical protein O3P69_013369 [Scylla paramamosain]|uniref:Uncharacterized protein n=1 Tax=Scylla paramamosain TaxID=85552 RepID=A0AAW0TZS4_SCYPA
METLYIEIHFWESGDERQLSTEMVIEASSQPELRQMTLVTGKLLDNFGDAYKLCNYLWVSLTSRAPPPSPTPVQLPPRTSECPGPRLNAHGKGDLMGQNPALLTNILTTYEYVRVELQFIGRRPRSASLRHPPPRLAHCTYPGTMVDCLRGDREMRQQKRRFVAPSL